MAKEYSSQQLSLSVSNTMLLFHLSLTCSSQNDENRIIVDDVSDFDDGFVFDIDPCLLVNCDKLDIGEMIGEGSYSIVYKGWYESRPVAIKMILPQRTKDATPECKAKFQREVKLLSRIDHRNVVKFIGATVKPSMTIITELLEGGSLQKNLKSIYPTAFSLEQCLNYALDISQAMEYLHANGIIHRDLKPGNLLLTEDKINVKVADFGTAREDICEEMTCEAGTYRYMAPELFSKDPLPKGAKKSYDRKADVYSFAIVMWSLIKNQTPFKERKDFMAAYAMANNMRPSVDGFPKDILPLLQSCWDDDPKLRPEFTEIVETLKRILQNLYSTKNISEHGDIKEVDSKIEEESAKTLSTTSLESSKKNENIPKLENETIKPNDRTHGKSESQSQSQSQNGILPALVQRKPKKKNKINRLFSCFRCCFAS